MEECGEPGMEKVSSQIAPHEMGMPEIKRPKRSVTLHA
jgi:hypothetical protein